MTDDDPKGFIDGTKDGVDAGEYLRGLQQVTRGGVLACPEGHVHVVVGGNHLVQTPDDAETWVEILYDAAQRAREVSDE